MKKCKLLKASRVSNINVMVITDWVDVKTSAIITFCLLYYAKTSHETRVPWKADFILNMKTITNVSRRNRTVGFNTSQ